MNVYGNEVTLASDKDSNYEPVKGRERFHKGDGDDRKDKEHKRDKISVNRLLALT